MHDGTVASKLVREDDEAVYGDFGYLGIDKRANNVEFKTNRPASRQRKLESRKQQLASGEQAYARICSVASSIHFVAGSSGLEPSTLKAFLKGVGFNADRDEEGGKPSVRCKAERVFLVAKGTSATRRRGIGALPKTRGAPLLKLLPLRTS